MKAARRSGQQDAGADGAGDGQRQHRRVPLSAKPAPRRLQPRKLLLSKWSAAVPIDKEKHFLVTRLIPPEAPGTEIDCIEMMAVYTGRRFVLRWRELGERAQWLQGWQ